VRVAPANRSGPLTEKLAEIVTVDDAVAVAVEIGVVVTARSPLTEQRAEVVTTSMIRADNGSSVSLGFAAYRCAARF